MEKEHIPFAKQHANEIQRDIRDLMKLLPDAFIDFLLSVEMTTQPLTRYAYSRDILIFLNYLINECPRFSGYETNRFSYNDFAQIKLRDFLLYQDYLLQYVRKSDQEDEKIIYETNDELGIMRKLCSIRSFYKFMYMTEKIPENVAEKIPLPKRHEKPIIRLEIEEMARMLSAVENQSEMTEHQKGYTDKTKKRDLAILTLFLGTGIRVSELVGIDLQDIDFELNGFLVTRKGGKEALLYFSDEVAAALQDYLEERMQIEAQPGHENAFFLSLQNKRINVRSVELMVKKYAKIAVPLKSKISPHKLRSTFGTNLYHQTGDIYLVADVLGHNDVNTTRRHYAAMSDDKRRLAAKVITIRDENQQSESETQDSPSQHQTE